MRDNYQLPITHYQSPALLRDVVEMATRWLTLAGCDTPRLDAEVLLAHALGRDRAWLYTHPQAALDEAEFNRFEVLLRRREQREPVAYIIGRKEFFGLEFAVNPHVLIPRPETELLVETGLQVASCRLQVSDHKSQVAERPLQITGYRSPITNYQLPITIVDVGTGSGCIAIALAKHLPQATITAIDVSPEALSLARQNALRHEVAGRITFLRGDLLQPLPEPVDLIVSNPPYVSRPDLAASVSPEVREYEPRLAFDGGEDGLQVIRRLLAQAGDKLKPGGSLLVEIGSTQGPAVSQIAQKYFPRATIRLERDLAGLDRLLVVQL